MDRQRIADLVGTSRDEARQFILDFHIEKIRNLLSHELKSPPIPSHASVYQLRHHALCILELSQLLWDLENCRGDKLSGISDMIIHQTRLMGGMANPDASLMSLGAYVSDGGFGFEYNNASKQSSWHYKFENPQEAIDFLLSSLGLVLDYAAKQELKAKSG